MKNLFLLLLVKQCEKEGFLLDKTKKDFDKFVDNYKNNKIKEEEYNNDMIVENITISSNEEELPFTPEEKIITYPL